MEYRVEYRVQSESLIMNATITDLTQTVLTVTDLTPGTSYQLRVIPVNSIGDGPQTNINARTGADYAYLLRTSISAHIHVIYFTDSTLYASLNLCTHTLHNHQSHAHVHNMYVVLSLISQVVFNIAKLEMGLGMRIHVHTHARH
jgi:hypothetical protein